MVSIDLNKLIVYSITAHIALLPLNVAAVCAQNRVFNWYNEPQGYRPQRTTWDEPEPETELDTEPDDSQDEERGGDTDAEVSDRTKKLTENENGPF